MTKLKPFFSYYGGKYRAAPLYPEPQHEWICEPFAGAAGYATRYPTHKVLLIDKSEAIAGVWDYLIRTKESEIRALPLVQHGEDVRTLKIPAEARNLIGLWVNNASAAPRNFLTKWALERPNGFWSQHIRERIASQVHAIRHWHVICGDFTDAPDDGPATWFVDPLYEKAGVHYPQGARKIDFTDLGAWCRSRVGQTIVCENEGAAWLPFRPFARIQSNPSSRGKGKSAEAVWLGGVPA